jgi:tetratricopeptide (TPR) repeat protein
LLIALCTAVALGGVEARAQGAPSTAPNAAADASAAHADYTRLVRAGEELAKSRQYDAAIENYDRALALGPPNRLAESVLLTYRAGALWHLGRKAQALGDQDRAVALNRNAFALWARGETLRKLGRFADALADYDATLRLVPDDAPSHIGRGGGALAARADRRGQGGL